MRLDTMQGYGLFLDVVKGFMFCMEVVRFKINI